MSQTTIDHPPASLDLAQPAPGAASPPLAIEALLWRMRSGDRDAAAEFLLRYGSRIRRRIRGKLGPSVRRLFDSLDILSTLGRRLDLYVLSGKLKVANENQLWTLLFRMADHALIDKARVLRLAQSIEHEVARRVTKPTHQANQENGGDIGVEVERCLAWLSDPVEKRILSDWLIGEPYGAIGRRLNVSEEAIRKRLEKIHSKLRVRFQASGT